MLQSHLVEIDGVFLGAAIRLDRGFRFVAVNLRVEQLDETIWPTLGDVERLARYLYQVGRLPERRNGQVLHAVDASRETPLFNPAPSTPVAVRQHEAGV